MTGKGDEKKGCDDFIRILSRESELTEAQMVFALPPRCGSHSSFKCNENADGLGIFGRTEREEKVLKNSRQIHSRKSRAGSGEHKLKGGFQLQKEEGMTSTA